MNKNQLNKIVTNLQTYVDDKINKLPVSYEEKLLLTVPKESIDKSKVDAATLNSPYTIQIPKDNGFEYTEGMVNNADFIIEYNGKKYICDIGIDENGNIMCRVFLENIIFGFIIPKDNSTNIKLAISKLDTTNITDIKLSMRKDDINVNDLTIDNSISIGRTGDIGINSSAIGSQVTASGDNSHAEGNSTTASGNSSHAEGHNTTASGNSSHAEGYNTITLGAFSHAEGSNTTASGDKSHAEGRDTTASGDKSHAEGYNTTASGNSSHAEGYNTTASGNSSHAEGDITTASGNQSHVEGFHTKASGEYQHVQGKFNIEDTANKYAHIVGNGTTLSARSNAHTLDWNGNGWYAGKLSQEGTPTEDKDLVTKKYFEENNITDAEIDAVFDELSMRPVKRYKINYDYNKLACVVYPTPSFIYENDEVNITVKLPPTTRYFIQSINVMQGKTDISDSVVDIDKGVITLKSINDDITIKVIIGENIPM